MTGILRFYLRNFRLGWNDCFTIANDRNNDDGSVDKSISRPRSFPALPQPFFTIATRGDL